MRLSLQMYNESCKYANSIINEKAAALISI